MRLELLQILFNRGEGGDSLTMSYGACMDFAGQMRWLKRQVDDVDSFLMDNAA